MPRGQRVSRDAWFPGITRTRKKNWATTTGRHLCWAYLSNLDFARENLIFIGPQFSIREQGLHTVGQENVLPQLTPSWGGEAGRRIYSMERTSTGIFEVAANPCNHGNFCKGSLETMGRPLSKYSGGKLPNLPSAAGTTYVAMSPLHRLPHHSHGASCQGLAAFPRGVLLGDGLCDQTFLTSEQPGERAQAFVTQVGLRRSGTPLLYGKKDLLLWMLAQILHSGRLETYPQICIFFPPFFLSLCISCIPSVVNISDQAHFYCYAEPGRTALGSRMMLLGCPNNALTLCFVF